MGARPPFSWSGILDPASSPKNKPYEPSFHTAIGDSQCRLSATREHRLPSASLPRRFPLTEITEFKRQTDQARRDAKLSSRLRRAHERTYPAPTSATSQCQRYCERASPSSVRDTLIPDRGIFIHAERANLSAALPDPGGESVPRRTNFLLVLSTISSGWIHTSVDYEVTYSGGNHHSHSISLPVTHDAGLLYQLPPVASKSNPSTPNSQENSHVRVVQSRPKPRCWEHGCNGRQFSTFSNLLRHQREKSGQAAKATCPNCGAEFTWTTARNGHMLHDKCKQRRAS